MQLGPRGPAPTPGLPPSRPPGPTPPSRPCWESCQLHPGGSVRLECPLPRSHLLSPSGIGEVVNVSQGEAPPVECEPGPEQVQTLVCLCDPRMAAVPEPPVELRIITAQDGPSCTVILAVRTEERLLGGGLGVCGAPWTMPCQGPAPCVGNRVCRA